MGRPSVTIKAVEAIRCIKAGMSDAALMEKFGISPAAVQSLIMQLHAAGFIQSSELSKRAKLTNESVIIDPDKLNLPSSQQKIVIDAAEAQRLIRSGMDTSALMRKYNLSIKGVKSLFKKLVSANAVSQSEFDLRFSDAEDQIIIDHVDSRKQAAAFLDEIDLFETVRMIKNGITRHELMKAYHISDAETDCLLAGLVERDLIAKSELDRRLSGRQYFFEIKNTANQVIYAGVSCSISNLLEKAVAEGIDCSESDLSGLDLGKCDLSGARFRRANFSRSNLAGTDLTGSVLCEAKLCSCNMLGAILHKANLSGANLSDANLSNVDASWAFLPQANLAESNLSFANFYGAHLARAILFETILIGTNLSGAYMEGVDLNGTRRELC